MLKLGERDRTCYCRNAHCRLLVYAEADAHQSGKQARRSVPQANAAAEESLARDARGREALLVNAGRVLMRAVSEINTKNNSPAPSRGTKGQCELGARLQKPLRNALKKSVSRSTQWINHAPSANARRHEASFLAKKERQLPSSLPGPPPRRTLSG